jgi:hypothetical protein
MSIDTIIGTAVILGAGYILWKMMTRGESVQEAVKETVAEAKSAADVNKDGKVDVADAVEVVKKTRAAAKKTGEKVKAATKKTKTTKAKA